MYEEYTDQQIVEMLKPKLSKILGDGMWDTALEHSESGRNLIRLIATIYRSAYIRGQHGRSFIIGEKKTKPNPGQTGHWIPATLVNIKKGDKVKMIDKDAHNFDPLCFPVAGTIGTVIDYDFYDVRVQWPKGTTSGNDRWYSYYNRLEVLVCE